MVQQDLAASRSEGQSKRAHWAVRIESAVWKGRRPSPANVVALSLLNACHSIARQSAASCPYAGPTFISSQSFQRSYAFFFNRARAGGRDASNGCARACFVPDGWTDRHESAVRARSSGTRSRALAHEGRGPNHEASNPWGGIGGALGIAPRPSC